MNFLAHFYLTRGHDELTAGNFIADFVRSSEHHRFSNNVLKGIGIHRTIDSFTDEHAIVERSKQRLRQKYHKYATVIVDVYYDHFLAANWKRFSNIPLAQFSNETYSLLRKQHHIFPFIAQRVFHYMAANDWLYSYHSVEGTGRALRGLAQRARHKSGMEKAVEDLENDYREFEQEFLLFFPELEKQIGELITVK